MGRSRTISERTVIYQGEGCSKFFVGCNPDSTNGVDIVVKGLHLETDPFPLYPDGGVVFEKKGIKEVVATPVGGDAIIDYGIVSK